MLMQVIATDTQAYSVRSGNNATLTAQNTAIMIRDWTGDSAGFVMPMNAMAETA
jgi:hypothetical protein